MPDKRTHRGPAPQDHYHFRAEALSALRRAAGHLSQLLTQGYAAKSALKLIGDRYGLTQRQRNAVMRAACSDQERNRRLAHRAAPKALAGETLLIDGYNILTSIEAALAGAYLLRGRDTCLRDLASMHGSFRKVAETLPALELIGDVLVAFAPAAVVWLLDKPVSNSGRLKTLINQRAAERAWPWGVELSYSPDHILAQTPHFIVSSDSEILNRCRAWINLAPLIVREHIPKARIIDLSSSQPF